MVRRGLLMLIPPTAITHHALFRHPRVNRSVNEQDGGYSKQPHRRGNGVPNCVEGTGPGAHEVPDRGDHRRQ